MTYSTFWRQEWYRPDDVQVKDFFGCPFNEPYLLKLVPYSVNSDYKRSKLFENERFKGGIPDAMLSRIERSLSKNKCFCRQNNLEEHPNMSNTNEEISANYSSYLWNKRTARWWGWNQRHKRPKCKRKMLNLMENRKNESIKDLFHGDTGDVSAESSSGICCNEHHNGRDRQKNCGRGDERHVETVQCSRYPCQKNDFTGINVTTERNKSISNIKPENNKQHKHYLIFDCFISLITLSKLSIGKLFSQYLLCYRNSTKKNNCDGVYEKCNFTDYSNENDTISLHITPSLAPYVMDIYEELKNDKGSELFTVGKRYAVYKSRGNSCLCVNLSDPKVHSSSNNVQFKCDASCTVDTSEEHKAQTESCSCGPLSSASVQISSHSSMDKDTVNYHPNINVLPVVPMCSCLSPTPHLSNITRNVHYLRQISDVNEFNVNRNIDGGKCTCPRDYEKHISSKSKKHEDIPVYSSQNKCNISNSEATVTHCDTRRKNFLQETLRSSLMKRLYETKSSIMTSKMTSHNEKKDLNEKKNVSLKEMSSDIANNKLSQHPEALKLEPPSFPKTNIIETRLRKSKSQDVLPKLSELTLCDKKRLQTTFTDLKPREN